MVTTFHALDKDLYNQEGFFEDYKKAQWANVSPEQSDKLFFLLNHGNDQTKKDKGLEYLKYTQ